MNVGNIPVLSGAEIRERRKERGMSREQLSAQLGISPRGLEQIEQGRVRVYPPLGKLARLVLSPEPIPAEGEPESIDMFPKDLIDVRQQLGISRQGMAERMGLDASTLEGMEKDKIPVTITVEKFATLLLEYHNLKSAQDLSKADLWRRLLEEKEKNIRIKANLEECGLI